MLLAAVRKRILTEMPLGLPEKFSRLRVFVRKFLRKFFKPFPTLGRAKRDELFFSWLKNYKKPLARKEELRNLYLERKPLYEHDFGIKSFIKREFYEENKMARLINSRTDRFKVAVAGWTHAIEEQIFHGPIADWFVKGKKTSLQPAMIMKMAKHPHFLATDYSSFESGFSPDYVAAVEMELWQFFLQENPDAYQDFYRSYIQQDIHGREIPRAEKCSGRTFSAVVTGTRMSGEMWTSLGNGFSNLMNFLFLMSEAGEYPETMPGPADAPFGALVEGDDGLFGMRTRALTNTDFEELGFKIKMEYTSNIEETSFCSNRFSPMTLHQLIPPEASIRCFYTHDPSLFRAGFSVQQSLLKAKAMSLNCQGKFSPIAGVLSTKILELCADTKARFDDFNMYEMMQLEIDLPDLGNAEPTIEDRQTYAKIYNMPIAKQLLIEDCIKQVKDIRELTFLMRISKISNTCSLETLRAADFGPQT